MRFAISYVSTVNPKLSKIEIQEALDFSKNWNNDHNITGILLYSQGNFFQVLEGEEQLLKSLFSRIKADERHKDVITLFKREIPNVKFDGYEADFISVDERHNFSQMESYLSHVDNLNPAIQSSVKYILKNFTEGIK
ncbi:BLUF domain-containing protein [Salegentibacter sp. F188]|uniref:BLUF domain-containing protein n=1 Tax=Autumnicola patrickiae TaxID=3075591 RepID=A0ABU3E517_9FLAO|nr:BLUF domain-containing protein [Salegentibacter sp. F188]MDT0691015.1 BLUF domain-containing protein [Salegentibacter sp. F188]